VTEIDQAQLGERTLKAVVYTEDVLRRRIAELAEEISVAYSEDDHLLVVGLLKGSFLFMADLVRQIRLPLQIDFLVASSYGDKAVSSGTVDLLYDPSADFSGRAVLIVEDVVDSGTTLEALVPRLESRGATKVDVCTLLHKRLPSALYEPRWVGFDAPNSFLVGYGLDYAEDFRHLPYIASI
jgi:hypoxanthine phosphoribosyltransferase